MDKTIKVDDKKFKIERRPINGEAEKKRNKIAGTIDDDIDDEPSVTMKEENW